MADGSQVAPEGAAPIARPRAYSYLRFSTPEQMRGDSFRRQSDLATAYAKQHDLDLDTELTFQDLGVSAYRGANAEADGQLGAFLEAVRTGLVPPGSYLLVESFDRISRENPWDAMDVLRPIINSGIKLVTLVDGRSYDQAYMRRDPLAIMMAIIVMMRANEESATKGRRVSEAWSAKRNKVATGEHSLYTRLAPAWLQWANDAWSLIPERAAIVQRVFTETLAGRGQAAIAKGLHDDGIKPWGRAKTWQRSYIKKLQSNVAVIGTLTPHAMSHDDPTGPRKGRRKPAGDPVPDHYPAAVDRATWDTVQAMLPGKGKFQPPAPRNGRVVHMLAGIARCGICGGTITRVHKGRRSTPKLVCQTAKTGRGCVYRSLPVSEVEAAIVGHLVGHVLIDPPSSPKAGQPDDEPRRVELRGLEHAIEAIEVAAERLANASLSPPSPVVRARLASLRYERGSLVAERDRLAAALADASGPMIATRIAELTDAIEAKPVAPSAVNAALRRVFSHVTVHPFDGTLAFTWRHTAVDAELRFRWPEGD